MLPAIAIEGGLLLALVRGLWVAALLSTFGTLAFRLWVVPRALARAPVEAQARMHQELGRLTWLSLAASAGMLAAWTLLQSAEIAGATGARAVLDATWQVLVGTVFGHLVLLQAAGLASVAAALGLGRLRLAAMAAAATVALQAGHGHSLAMVAGPSLLLLAGVSHLLAAGAWLGGLLPLLLVVRTAPARTAAAAARWFSPLGKWCIAFLAASALVQYWQLVGGLPGLVGTAYGWMALVKLALLAALLGFAAANRHWLAPRLLGADAASGRTVLMRSIAVQTGVGAAVLFAAAMLSSLPPAIHEQPVWLFAERPSLVVLGDADLQAEIVDAAVGVLLALALIAVGVALHRRRVLALAGVAIGLWVGAAAASHLDLLFVQAYPTSYFHSPTGFAATGIAGGAVLFPQHCASCHGAEGRGDGPAAKALADPPADLTAEHLWAHEDGELFWWLSHGIEAPEGGLAMPGFAGQLGEDDRWALIDYIRAHNAGVAFHDTHAWPVPVQAPDFTLSCPGGRTATVADLRGSVLRLVALAPAGDPPPPAPGVPAVTVLMTRGGQPAAPDACVTTDPTVWQAYAVILGLPADSLAGAQVLVDQNGWLRAAEAPAGAATRWADPALLLADVQAIARHPLAAVSVGHVHH